jgi:orotate phosphoribosyltransferase
VAHSAVQYVQQQLGLQVCAIAKLADLMHYLEKNSAHGLAADRQRVLAYRQRYGVEEG